MKVLKAFHNNINQANL